VSRTKFKRIAVSLADLLGARYMGAVVAALAKLTGRRADTLRKLAERKVDFFPDSFQRRLVSLLPKVGARIGRALAGSPRGAPSRAFGLASRPGQAPLTGWGYYRAAEDGRLMFLSKSEHYHAPLGHSFPGYRLLEIAHELGIVNPTHNNTRGYVTRRLEAELVRTTNGLAQSDRAGLAKALRSRRAGVLSRVLNLQTGSLAAEAGIKMMLARFHKPQDNSPTPKYAGRTPVLAVIGDDTGGLGANYHGTTVLDQILRGMWPALREGLEKQGLLKIAPVRPESFEDLDALFDKYERGRYKIAGFLHEIVLMNYGALRLSERFVKRIYTLCRTRDVPVMVDEIQSCLWSPQLYTYLEYGVRPNLVVLGKGIPGGEYSGSRIIFDAGMDSLPQFGSLVTNGQEELASLAYLITMRWAAANADVTRAVGDDYEAKLRDLADANPRLLASAQGSRHMGALHFHDLPVAQAFVKRLVAGGLDISVQTYKADCPPAALTKLPIIAGRDAVEMVVARMAEALRKL